MCDFKYMNKKIHTHNLLKIAFFSEAGIYIIYYNPIYIGLFISY